MGTGMQEARSLTPTVVDRRVSIVRLHGEACFDCGAVNKPLRVAGEVVVRGATRVWQIRSCGCRRGAPRKTQPAGGATQNPATARTAPGVANAQTSEGAST
jgi:hypothetical protein